ncbi:centrosomal protein CEP57L1 isoform X2 [Ochotona curzoniae]|uniref:centrosomal protein CEP57L1 isoform X2 n=1 Tax=Ochotona curzoniae TaxID=130825 RepID=UPI001B34D8B3|nr:centrosomal protein CEP57L1 isoform X2 [Ochotona curzoniae]
MDSELMHSIVGSYLRPPERVFVPTCPQNESHQNHFPVNKQGTSSKVLQSPNSQALVLALRTLQEKIHRLELERTQAEDNLNILSREAAQYKKALQNETNERNLAHQELIKQKKDISIQLSSAQSRCTLLEKQLEYTKRMVLNVEREKNMILEQQALLQREKEQDQMKLHAKLEKLDVLEKECLRLTATQKTAEDKIKQLEEKLKEEEHHRKLFQDKASELQTGLEISKILMSSVSNPKNSKEKKKSSKKAKCLKRGSPHPTYSKFEALPFETEKPATTGSSANASVHSLLHTMQQRRPQVLQKPEVAEHGGCLCRPTRKTSLCKAFASDSAKSTSMCDNLSELLMAMQDELDQMCVEHQELLRQMKDTESHSVYGDIECELEHLVKKMEIKKEQISKLRKHQNSVHKLQQKVQNSKMRTAAGTQREEYHQPNRSKNIKNSPRKCVNEASPSQKSSHSHPVRIHNVQVKLRKDDVVWEQ